MLVSPTYVPDLAHACLDLLIDDEQGLWHLANEGAITWADLARCAAEQAGLDPAGVEGVPVETLGLAARRPAYSVLGTERGALLPTLVEGLNRYFHDCSVPWIDPACPIQRPKRERRPSPERAVKKPASPGGKEATVR